MTTAELQALQAENTELKRKLEICAKWMKRQIEEDVHRIAKRKVTKMTETGKEEFLRENQEQILGKQIHDYFGDILLLNAPRETLEYLINAEINFYNLQRNPSIDGFTVISSFQKIIDALIEQCITNDFRKFANKKGYTMLRTNDPLEKALHLVVNKKYILSTGRLYGLLKAIHENERLYEYGTAFSLYLDKYSSLKELLLWDNFYKLFEKVIKSEIFGAKRHTGSISLQETKEAREWIVGDFINKTSLLYLMLESQTVMY